MKCLYTLEPTALELQGGRINFKKNSIMNRSINKGWLLYWLSAVPVLRRGEEKRGIRH
jgi:hypothetical protein